jgi:hypothetical protein
MSIIAFLGFSLFLFLVEPEIPDDEIQALNQTEPSSKHISDILDKDEGEGEDEVEDDRVKTPLISPKDKEEREDEKDINYNNSLTSTKSNATFTSTLRLLKTSNMLKLLGMITMTGVAVVVIGGLLVKMISNSIESGSDNDKLTKALYAMILLGVGEVIGSSTLGQLIDYTSNKIGVIAVLASLSITT